MHIPALVADDQDSSPPAPTSALSLPHILKSSAGKRKLTICATGAVTSTEAFIPSKFLVGTQTAPVKSFHSITRASDAAVVTMDATVEANRPLSYNNVPAATSAKFRDDLPDMPEWAVGLMAGLLAFGLVIAIVLYLANFPPTFTWVHRLLRQRIKTRYGYARLWDGGAEEPDGDGRNMSSGASSSTTDSDGSGSATAFAVNGANATRRRRTSLVVDTSARYTGLGIAMALGDGVTERSEPRTATGQRRRSYDEEAMRLRRLKPRSSPVRTAWAALTAPLPSVSLFGRRSPTTVARGPHTSATPATAEHDSRGWRDSELDSGTDYATSPYTRYPVQDPLYGPETSAEIDGLFGRLGSGIGSVAGKLAVLFHEPVEGAEEGLLLAVKDCEREPALP